MSLRAFAVLAAVAAGGAALAVRPHGGPGRRQVAPPPPRLRGPAPWLRPSPARWERRRLAGERCRGRHPALRGWHGDGTGCISYEEEAEWAVLRARLEAEQDEWRQP